MATTTLTVPAKHVDAWRDAVLVELRDDAGWLANGVEEVQRHLFTDRDRIESARLREIEAEPPRLPSIGDVLDAVVEIERDCEILRATFEDTDGELEITGAAEVLGHICETMAHKVLPPRISDATCTAPYTGQVAAEIADVLEALTWAASEASRLHAAWADQFEAEKAARS